MFTGILLTLITHLQKYLKQHIKALSQPLACADDCSVLLHNSIVCTWSVRRQRHRGGAGQRHPALRLGVPRPGAQPAAAAGTRAGAPRVRAIHRPQPGQGERGAVPGGAGWAGPAARAGGQADLQNIGLRGLLLSHHRA